MKLSTVIRRSGIVLSCIALLAGCSDPTPVVNERLKLNGQTGRINVVSASVITDARGYNRDILVLRDSETGDEYLAVMGAGVMDMHRVTTSTGKTTTSRMVEE